jgi:hypothetical protein
MAKKKASLIDKVNALQRKYALSLQVKQDIDRLVKSAYNAGVNSTKE